MCWTSDANRERHKSDTSTTNRYAPQVQEHAERELRFRYDWRVGARCCRQRSAGARLAACPTRAALLTRYGGW
jgi:hypothetical protein